MRSIRFPTRNLVALVGWLFLAVKTGAADTTSPTTRVETSLRVANVAAGIISAGELALPESKGPHPIVIQLGGGFQPLTEELTRHGIAVLSFDLRGSGNSEGTYSFWNPEAIAEDETLWLAWLKQRPDIDRRRIGLIGHSQCGVAAALVAARATNAVSRVVLLASIGVPVLEWRVKQIADQIESIGLSPATAAKFTTFQRELFQNIVGAKDTAEATQRTRSTTINHLVRFTAEERSQLGLSDDPAEQFSKQAGEAWYRHYLAYDPRPPLRQIRCPVFALHGLADRQVSAKENLASIAAELKAGGYAQVKLLELPGLDHEFRVVARDAPAAPMTDPQPLSKEAIEAVSRWISEQTDR